MSEHAEEQQKEPRPQPNATNVESASSSEAASSKAASAAADGVKMMEISDDKENDNVGNNGSTGNAQEGRAENAADVDAEKEEEEGDSSDETMDDDDDKGDGDDDEDMGISEDRANEMLMEGMSLKEEGNGHFKRGELDKACRSYRRGVSKLKKLNHNNTGDEQVKSLLVTLHTNLSTVFFKQQKYKISADAATNAVKVAEGNGSSSSAAVVKALYRRAVAGRKLGNDEGSRADLKRALQLDASNAACKKELASIKKEMEQSKASQKKAFAKAFSGDSKSSFLYTDKEEEERRKQEEAKKRKEREQELLKKRKADWEDECVKRMANNQPAVSFEEWEKEIKDKEEKAKKEEEKKRKEDERRRKEEARKRREAARKSSSRDSDSDDDDDELTEQELAMMRGYKKTKDGRTTSYFTREISEEERRRLGDIAPKRITEASSPSTPSPSAAACAGGPAPATSNSAESSSDGGGVSVARSAWNQAGTWEEKNCTTWCTERLRERLNATSATAVDAAANVTSIESLTGEASVAIAGNKKRYIFDYHVKLKYEVVTKTVGGDDGEDGGGGKKKTIAKGVVRLPDICSISHDEVEVVYDSYTKKPKTEEQERQASLCRTELTNSIRADIQRWVQDFNNMY